jgi:phage terminase large subunit
MYQETTATRKIFALEKRIRAVCGGTSASKTVSILIYLIDYAISKENTSISVVSESFPHLKRGAIRDFTEIMKEHGYWHESMWNATDKIFNFPNGSFIEFFSVDQPDKVRGPRRDILFINECNNIPYEAFDQLEIRTKNLIWLDWNPTNEFWFYDKVKQRPDVDFITLTYKDNKESPQKKSPKEKNLEQ